MFFLIVFFCSVFAQSPSHNGTSPPTTPPPPTTTKITNDYVSPSQMWLDAVITPVPSILLPNVNYNPNTTNNKHKFNQFYIDTTTPISYAFNLCGDVPSCAKDMNVNSVACRELIRAKNSGSLDILFRTENFVDVSTPFLVKCELNPFVFLRQKVNLLTAAICIEITPPKLSSSVIAGVIGTLPTPRLGSGCSAISPPFSTCSVSGKTCSVPYDHVDPSMPSSGLFVLDIPRYRVGMFRNMSELSVAAPFLQIAMSEVIPIGYLSQPRLMLNALGYFTVGEIKLCGSDLSFVDSSSEEWLSSGAFAVVDTLTPCLSLPTEFYEGVIAWLSLICPRVIETDVIQDNKSLLDDFCRLPVSLDETSLPTMFMTLGGKHDSSTQGASKNYSTIQIPLADLVVPDTRTATEGSKLCLRNSGSLQDYINDIRRDARTTLVYRNPPAITLGSMALSSLVVVFDGANRKVGIHSEPSVNSQRGCQTPKVCYGEQLYDEVRNLCHDPDCSVQFLKTLNVELKKCEVPASTWSGLCLMVFLLLIIEVGMSEYNDKILRKIPNGSRARGPPQVVT